jgi:hypothetical protein
MKINPSHNIYHEVIALQGRIENVTHRQLYLFKIDSSQRAEEIESLELKKKVAVQKYIEEKEKHGSWTVFNHVSQYIGGTSTLLLGGSVGGLAGAALTASGALALGHKIIGDTVGWKNSYLDTGTKYLSLGLGCMGGIGAYYTGTFTLANGLKSSIQEVMSMAGTLSGAAANIGESYTGWQMSDAQADRKEIDAAITAKQQMITEGCRKMADAVNTDLSIVESMRQIIQTSEIDQNG